VADAYTLRSLAEDVMAKGQEHGIRPEVAWLVGRVQEHLPADDAEPFTVEWFEAAYKSPDCGCYEAGMIGSATQFQVIAVKDPAGQFRKTTVPAGSTRGDVRRFLAWQGVEAKTRNSESEGS
jgi:hypothetical protein